MFSAVLPTTDMRRVRQHVRSVPNSEVAASFNHLVGSGEQCRRHGEAKCLRGLEIDDQFEFRRLLDRQLGWLCSFQDLVGVDRGSTIQVEYIRPVGNEATEFHKLPSVIHRGYPRELQALLGARQE